MSRWQKVGENLVRHRSGTIYLQVWDGSKCIRKSLGTDDIRLAKNTRDPEIQRLREEAKEMRTSVKRIATIGDAFAVVEARIRSTAGIRDSTVRYHGQILATLRQALPLALPASQWTRDAIAAWWKGYTTGRSAQRVNSALRMLRMLGEVMVEHRTHSKNPFLDMRRRRPGKAELLNMPSVEEMTRLIESVRSNQKASAEESANMIAWMAWSGMRIGEVRGLRWEDIGETWVVVTGGECGTKNGEQRRIPLNDHLRAVVERMRWDGAGGPVFSILSPRRALDSVCERMGLQHLRIHDLRHWFATHAIEAGVDVPTVSRWLGHRDGGALAMRTYGHARDSHSLESAKKL